MPTRAQAIRACILVLALVAIAFVALRGVQRQAEATEGAGYPEVVEEVVEPLQAVWWGDSIACVVTELNARGQICGTIGGQP